MQGKEFWYGLEVEGRLLGVQTVFVRSKIPEDFNKYPHIYFTIEYTHTCVDNDDWQDIENILDNSRQICSIEVNEHTVDKIPMYIFNHSHLIYRINTDEKIAKLKASDTVSLDDAPYRVFQTTKHQLLSVTPDSYKYDKL